MQRCQHMRAAFDGMRNRERQTSANNDVLNLCGTKGLIGLGFREGDITECPQFNGLMRYAPPSTKNTLGRLQSSPV